MIGHWLNHGDPVDLNYKDDIEKRRENIARKAFCQLAQRRYNVGNPLPSTYESVKGLTSNDRWDFVSSVIHDQFGEFNYSLIEQALELRLVPDKSEDVTDPVSILSARPFASIEKKADALCTILLQSSRIPARPPPVTQRNLVTQEYIDSRLRTSLGRTVFFPAVTGARLALIQYDLNEAVVRNAFYIDSPRHIDN